LYLSNEETTQVSVFFDDLKVEHVKSPIVSASDFYAFGLPFNNFSRENTLPQKFLYQSKEWQTDLGLDLYDFEWRQYDPFTVRTTTMDPMAEGFYEFSQYSLPARTSTHDPWMIQRLRELHGRRKRN
jgi:hypothetical protein